MMDEGLKYLSDIHKAIVLIEAFTTGTMNYEDYSADLKTQSAVERQLGIIGEAVKKFDALMPEQALSQTRKIAGFRNRLIHAYDWIDASMVWVIIIKHLPSLKSEVELRIKG